jgi:hypothetical protein
MALLTHAGFDNFGINTEMITDNWVLSAGGPAFVAMRNGNGMRLVGNTTLHKRITSASSTYIVNFAFRLTALNTSTATIVQLLNSSTVHIELKLDTSQRLFVTRGDGVQLGGTGTTSLFVGTIYFIEMKVVINDTTGAVTVKLNNVAEAPITSTNVDTKNGATSTVDRIQFTNPAFSPYNLDYDDFSVLDGAGAAPNNDFIGDTKVITKFPSGAGATTNFTPSAGSNFQNVDEAAPDGDSTYNTSSTAGHIDLFTFPALGLVGTVFGVRTLSLVRKDDAGSRTMRGKVRSGGVNFNGASVSVPSTYIHLSDMWETDPNTAAAWTVANVDSAQVGYELVS